MQPHSSSVDFVSSFLLDTRKGYCTYFATAMTVMCRISGIPARYVEGFVADPDMNGRAWVTGKQGHAWTEVYLAGFGWLTFDSTPQDAIGSNAGFSGNSQLQDPSIPTPPPLMQELQTPPPEPEDDQEDADEPPTDDPDDPDEDEDENSEDDPDEDQPDADEPSSQDGNGIHIPWGWILGILLLAAAAAMVTWRIISQAP